MTGSSSLATRRNSVQPGDQIFVKGYGFLSFAKNVVKNIGKNIKLLINYESFKKLNSKIN